jgi:hypothetical protein
MTTSAPAEDDPPSVRPITKEHARYLVDAYYQMQDWRIDSANRVRAATKSEEEVPEILSSIYERTRGQEEEIKKALGAWARTSPAGAWAQSQYGIGPVISAGLVAHIDINRAPTVGHIWRFAGLDSTLEWHGATIARDLVRSAMEAEESESAAVWWLSQATHRKATALWEAMGVEPPTTEEATLVTATLAGASKPDVEVLFAERMDVENAINYACQELGVAAKDVFETLYSDAKFDRQALVTILAKRPYNAKLKVLCWKASDSFRKFSNREDCYYGHIYRKRKAYEVDRNEAKDYSGQAEETLSKRRIRESGTKEWYEKGMLPPGRIDLRAMRYAVKLFLAHFHEVDYRETFHREPPLPYPIVHLGHADKIDPPGYETP